MGHLLLEEQERLALELKLTIHGLTGPIIDGVFKTMRRTGTIWTTRHDVQVAPARRFTDERW